MHLSFTAAVLDYSIGILICLTTIYLDLKETSK